MLPVVHSDLEHQFGDKLYLPGPPKQATAAGAALAEAFEP